MSHNLIFHIPDFHDSKILNNIFLMVVLYFCPWIYIYIYIYIDCHLQTDCFVVSQLFSVPWQAGRFKLESRPTQLYVRQSIIPHTPQSTYVSLRIIKHYVAAFVCWHFALPDTREPKSFEEFCITRVAAINSFARELNPGRKEGASIYIYIYICKTLRMIWVLWDLGGRWADVCKQ